MIVRDVFGYNDILRGSQAAKTYSLMIDEVSTPGRAALGPRRLYVDGTAIKKRDDAVNWNRLTLTKTHQNFELKTIIQELNDRGASVIWCSQGAFGNQTIMTNEPPNGAPMTGFSGMLMPIDVYENATYTVEDAAAINQFVVDNSVDVSISEIIRVGEVKRVITNVQADTPVSGQKTITVDVDFDSTILTGTPVNYTRNDPYDPDSYHEIADALAMVARIYGHTPDAGGLQPFIDSGVLATNTDQTGGPLDNGTGLGTVAVIEIQNEATLPAFFGPIGDPDDSGGEIAFDFTSFPACVKKCYDAIRAVDKKVGIMVGGFWGLGNEQFYEDFVTGWTDLFGSPPPGDLMFSWHGYWRNSTLTTGIQPEVATNDVGSYVPLGWGDRGIFSVVDGWDRMRYKWIQGEYNWNSSAGQNLTTPILSGITGTDQEKREKSQGILTARMTLILLTGRYCEGAISYWLIDGSASDNGTGQYSNTGIIKNQFNTDSFGEKECKPYHEEMMEEFGDCLLPLHLVRGTPSEVIILGIKADGTIRKATWTSDSPITYSTLSTTYTADIYKDIQHDLALNAAHASAIATSNEWPAMRGRSIITSGCTFSSNLVVAANYDSIPVSLADTDSYAELFILFESDGTSVSLVSKDISTQIVSIVSQSVFFNGVDTGLDIDAGVNALYVKFNGSDSEIQINGGSIVSIDASASPLTVPFYIGEANIKAVFLRSKLSYSDEERESILAEFGF